MLETYIFLFKLNRNSSHYSWLIIYSLKLTIQIESEICKFLSFKYCTYLTLTWTKILNKISEQEFWTRILNKNPEQEFWIRILYKNSEQVLILYISIHSSMFKSIFKEYIIIQDWYKMFLNLHISIQSSLF